MTLLSVNPKYLLKTSDVPPVLTDVTHHDDKEEGSDTLGYNGPPEFQGPGKENGQ